MEHTAAAGARGIPNGWLGALLAMGFGIVLHRIVVRHLGDLRLAFAAHWAANAAMLTILVLFPDVMFVSGTL